MSREIPLPRPGFNSGNRIAGNVQEVVELADVCADVPVQEGDFESSPSPPSRPPDEVETEP